MATTEPAPTIQVGETPANFFARQTDWAFRNGTGGSGPNVAPAAQMLAFLQSPSVPKGFEVL